MKETPSTSTDKAAASAMSAGKAVRSGATKVMAALNLFLALLLIGLLAKATATESASGEAADITFGQGQPGFAGHWQLNEKLSDDPREKFIEAFRSRFGGRGGGGGGRGGGGGGRGGRGFGGRGGPMQALTQQVFEGDSSLVITYGEPELMFEYAGGRQRTLYTDGREVNMSGEDNPMDATIKASWEGAKMVVVTTTSSGDRITETYELLADVRRLVLTAEVENQRLGEPITIRRVYDPEG
ncbi:MAG: hypothetical protein ACE5HV_09090 [Acidobacteriota bacterium]